MLIPGVVETGIFVKMAKKAFFGMADGTVKEQSRIWSELHRRYAKPWPNGVVLIPLYSFKRDNRKRFIALYEKVYIYIFKNIFLRFFFTLRWCRSDLLGKWYEFNKWNRTANETLNKC